MSTNYSAPAVTKLLDIIELLSRENKGFGMNEIARLLNISVNSVFRICREMEERGYLEKNNTTGLYTLGTKFYIIGQLVGDRIDLRTKAMPIMQALCSEINETVHLCLLQETKMVLLDQIETTLPIRIHVETGSLMYPHGSAFGKCLLAYQTKNVIDTIIDSGLEALTEKTITNDTLLLEHLKLVRQNRYAFDIEEYMNGVHCVGAAVHSRKSEGVAGIGIIAPSYRFSQEKMKEMVPKIVDAAERLSMSLGYEPHCDELTKISISKDPIQPW